MSASFMESMNRESDDTKAHYAKVPEAVICQNVREEIFVMV